MQSLSLQLNQLKLSTNFELSIKTMTVKLLTNNNEFQQKSKPTGGGEGREVVQDQPGGW